LFAEADAASRHELTQALGCRLGEKLWCAHIGGLLSKDEVRTLFVGPLEGDGVAAGRCFERSARLAGGRGAVDAVSAGRPQ
jgi:hypothetical protein